MTIRSRHLVVAVITALLLGAVAGLAWRVAEGPSPPGERVRDAAARARGAAQRATQSAGGTDRGAAPEPP